MPIGTVARDADRVHSSTSMNAPGFTAGPGERSIDVEFVEDERERRPSYDELQDANDRLVARLERLQAIASPVPSARLSSRLAVALKDATRAMCQHVQIVDHADTRAEGVTVLVLTMVLGRVAEDPSVTVTETLDALNELATANGGAV